MGETSPLIPGRDDRGTLRLWNRKFVITFVACALVLCLALVGVPNNNKRNELVQWVVPAQADNVPVKKGVRYMYVKSNYLHYDKKSKHQVLDDAVMEHNNRLSGQILASIGKNQTTAPSQEIRSCAVSSLVTQATLVLHGWGVCGYLLHPVSESTSNPVMGFVANWTDGPDSVISGPANNTYCTPNRMNKPPCNVEWVRTLARNDPSSFRTCLGKIKGVSETCSAFDKCGPHPTVPKESSWGSSTPSTGVCNTADFSYYKEPEILAMCGICDMFRATMGTSFVSPRAGFLPDPAATSGAQGLRSGLSVIWTLAAAGVSLLSLRQL